MCSSVLDVMTDLQETLYRGTEGPRDALVSRNSATMVQNNPFEN